MIKEVFGGLGNMVEHTETSIKIRFGQLTENELYIVIDIVKRFMEPLGVTLGEPTKPEPMYRDVEFTGPHQVINDIVDLLQNCRVIYD
jgi:hypothetical protein